MTRARSSKVAIVATAVLIATGMLSGPVSAADSREMYLGSAPLTAPDFANAGILLPTAVSQGGTTMFTVSLVSNDNQTVAHAEMSVAIATTPLGLTLDTFYDPDGGTDADDCEAVTGGIDCDFGNLPGFAERTIAVVVNVSSTFPTAGAGALFTASATTNNENGSNQQLFAASSGNFAVTGADPNALKTFAKPGLAKHLETSAIGTANAGKIQTLIDFTADGGGDTVAITDGANPSGKYACPAGLTCQADYSEVLFERTSFGDDPYLKWTVKAQVPGTYTLAKGFLVHYTSATTADATMFFKDKTVYCGTDVAAKLASAHQCIQTATLTKVDKATGFATLTIVAYFDHNGGSRF